MALIPINRLKLYLFNSTEEWDTATARGVFAYCVEDAVKFSGITWTEYKVEEFEITEGLVVIADGYDNASIYIEEVK